MFCEKCGTQNSDNAKFCATCGNTLRATGFSDNQSTQAYTPMPQPTPYGGYGYTEAPKQKGNGAFMALKFTSVVLALVYIVFGFLPILMVKGLYSYGMTSAKSTLGIGGSPNFIEFFDFAGKCIKNHETVYGILFFVACGLLILAMLLFLIYGIVAAVKKNGATGLGIFAGVMGAVASIFWIVMIFVVNGPSQILMVYDLSAFPWIMACISIVTIILVAISSSKSPKKQNNDYQQRYY